MISKPVPANSFYHTCRYICNKPGAEVILAEGVRGHDYKLMSDDFIMQQQLRPEKKQACFHSILSFYPGEKPADELLKEIALKYLERLGIKGTQFAISKHTDKAHLHLHIVANMINNEGKAISDSWIGLRGKKIAQTLTQEYKLIPALEKNLSLSNLEALAQPEKIKYKIYMAIAENLLRCRTLDELEAKLLKLGIQTQYKYKGQTNEKQGVSFKKDNISFKGSHVDRKFSYAGLEKTFALKQQQELQQQKPEENKKERHITSEPKGTTYPIAKVDSHEKFEKIESKELEKSLEKAIDILWKAEQGQQQVDDKLPGDLRRRKKKRRLRL